LSDQSGLASCSPLPVGILLLLSSNGRLDWSFWFGLGIAVYGLSVGLTKSLYVLRIHREAASSSQAV